MTLYLAIVIGLTLAFTAATIAACLTPTWGWLADRNEARTRRRDVTAGDCAAEVLRLNAQKRADDAIVRCVDDFRRDLSFAATVEAIRALPEVGRS